MAYNPFNIFRRNQKALFAVLTVFVMIVFTLSSGVAGGDFFETFSRWLGAKGSKEAVGKIDGHTVTLGELEGGPRSVQFRRTIANRFMYYAAAQTVNELRAMANQQRAKLSESGAQMADAASRAIGILDLLSDPRSRNDPRVGQLLNEVQVARQLVNRAIDAPNTRPEDREVAGIYRTIFLLQEHLRVGSEHYFVNAPNRTRRDLIEFLLWEKKADQLGIKFTKDDVKRLIQAEFYNSFRSDVEVRKILQQMQGFTMDGCLEALASEFKVRSAQSALLGYNTRFGAATTYAVPYEAFEYYRDQTSPAEYQVIAVPAAGFVDRVVGEPSDSDINALWSKYADDEPNPRKETPGFKEPRKISIAYFGVTGEEPYYKKLAEEQIRVGEVMAKASGALTVPLPGGTGAWAALAAAPLTLKAPAVDAAYTAYETRFKNVMRNEYSSASVSSRDILEPNWAKPGVAAAAVGAFVGQSAGLGNPATATALTMAAPITYELRSRVAVGTPLVLGFVPSPALVPTLVGAAASSTLQQPKPLSIEAQRPELLKATIDKRAKALAYGERPDPMSFDVKANAEKGDIERFIEELKKMSENDRPKDKAAVEKYIAEFIKTRGITNTGKSTGPRDEYTIEDDPALAKLVEAHRESLRRAKGAHGGIDPYIPFGQSFFWTSKFDPNTFSSRRVQATALYQGEPFPPADRSADDGRTHYVYWRTEDISPKKTTLSAARPAIVAAWKRAKARELAQKKANELADKIRAHPSSDPNLLLPTVMQLQYELQSDIKDPKAQRQATRFAINGVAPLTSGPTGQLARYELIPSENLPYPTIEMETALLENRDKPPKTVLVLPDAAKDTYYVATLLRRDLKTPTDFKFEVYSQFGRARQMLYLHQAEAMRKSRQSVVDLLKKEFRYEETEEQKKKLDENAKSGGRD